jgi:hypothetical protein
VEALQIFSASENAKSYGMLTAIAGYVLAREK